MNAADCAQAADLSMVINRVVPDALAPDVVALGLLTYLTALAGSATPEQRHRMAVLACNAASELAHVPLPPN